MRPRGGFTLIEVLLVILLIGVLASQVVLNLHGENRAQKLEKETSKLQGRIHLAAELAMLKNVELGVYLDKQGYRFMLYDKDRWLSIREPKALAPYEFPTNIVLSTDLEGLEFAEQNLLSDANWRPEDTELFENSSFDEQKQQEELEQQLKDEQARVEQGKSGSGKKSKKRQTGILTDVPTRQDPRFPTLFILSSGEISPAELTLSETTDRPHLTQQLKAVFSIPLQKGAVEHGR